MHDNLPSDLDRFVADHVAFTRPSFRPSARFRLTNTTSLYRFPDRDVRHGVEHEDSTVIAIGPAERVRSEEGYMEILGIASHDRTTPGTSNASPAEWTPYDHGTLPSELGYVAEGVTTYIRLFCSEPDCGFEGCAR